MVLVYEFNDLNSLPARMEFLRGTAPNAPEAQARPEPPAPRSNPHVYQDLERERQVQNRVEQYQRVSPPARDCPLSE